MGRLHVLHCIYDDPGNPWVAGGGSVRVFEIYRRLVGRLGSVTVAAGAYPGAHDVVRAGIRYRFLGVPRPYPLSRLSYSAAASRLLARRQYDVAVFDFSTYTPLRWPDDATVGVTVHHLTGGSATDRWGTLVGRAVAAQERYRLRRARHFTATSRATFEQLREIVGPRPEIHLVQAGVPDELFELPRREGEELLYFGRLDWHQKGLDVLLEAMAILVEERPGLRLRIAGRGKDADRVRTAIQKLGLAANVEMLGAVGDEARADLLATARLLLMPSRFEGFGMVAAEAMAAGVPLVAAAAGSLPEVVDAPRGGVLVPPGSATALAGAAADLLNSDEKRRVLSRSARESAQRFRWDRVADQHLEFLQSIHARGSGRPSEPVE